MKPMTLAARLAWSFAGLFLMGMLLVSAFAYFELVIEPRSAPDEHLTVPHVMLEIAGEAFIAVALIAFGGWWLARRAMRPIVSLADAADRIHEGNLREQIIPPRGDAEFVRLAHVFNAMTIRLDESFQRVREFTLYASHELKTPLSVLHGEFERLVDDPARTDADRATFARHLDEIERLSQIVDGLAFLTKADSHLVTLNSEPVLLKPLVVAATEDTVVLGAEQGITVTLDHCDDACIMADRHRIRQLLVILCDNAVKHNRPNGSVQISLNRIGKRVSFSIANTGFGVPADEQGSVFERFYRGSNVKADGVEGTGLGLSVAQWIAVAHEGTLTFTSEPDRTIFVFQAACLDGE